jgi:hypothetical protein
VGQSASRVIQETLETPPERPPRAGAALPLDVLIAPSRAFRAIEATREWLPAYLVVVALGMLELYLLTPALSKVLALQLHAGAPGAPAPQAIRQAMLVEGIWRVLGPLFAWGFVATLLAAATIGLRNPSSTWTTFFSLAMNCALPAAIGGVVVALAVRFHSPATLRTASDLLLAAPISLASLRPNGSPREIAFLGYWDVFTLWSLLLLGYGFSAIAKMKHIPALLLALAIGLSFALMQAAATQ